MASTTINNARMDTSFWRSIRWQNAALAGLVVGAILFFVRGGIPWVASGAINPNVMGFDPNPGAAGKPGYFFTTLLMHLGVATAYGLVVGAIAHSFRPLAAGAVGAAVGLVLYFINYAIFTGVVGNEVPQRELAVALHHVAYGILTAEFYKGMVRRRTPAPLM